MKNFRVELLKHQDIINLRDVIEDDSIIYNEEGIEKFISGKQNLAFIAKLDDRIIGLLYGYILVRLDALRPQFFIYYVGIHLKYQNNGYGSEMVKYAVNYAQENNFYSTFIITEKDNFRACRVYEKAGGKYDEKDCDRVYRIIY